MLARALPVPTDPAVARSSIGSRLLAFARDQLTQAESHLARTGEAIHGGVHQSRKSLRRVRATLALGGHSLGPRADGLDRELARLCRGLSHVRDAQALLEALSRLEANASADLRSSMPDLMATARAHRDRILRKALAQDSAFASRRARLQRACKRLDRLTWQQLDEASVAESLARSERRALKAERRACRPRHDDRDWHTFRRRLRRLRQQDSLLAEVQAGLHSGQHDLEERATALGEAQDDALLLRACGRRSPFSAEQRALLRQVARERLRRVRVARH